MDSDRQLGRPIRLVHLPRGGSWSVGISCLLMKVVRKQERRCSNAVHLYKMLTAFLRMQFSSGSVISGQPAPTSCGHTLTRAFNPCCQHCGFVCIIATKGFFSQDSDAYLFSMGFFALQRLRARRLWGGREDATDQKGVNFCSFETKAKQGAYKSAPSLSCECKDGSARAPAV